MMLHKHVPVERGEGLVSSYHCGQRLHANFNERRVLFVSDRLHELTDVGFVQSRTVLRNVGQKLMYMFRR